MLPTLETARGVPWPGKLPEHHKAIVTKVREDFGGETKMRRGVRTYLSPDRLLLLFRSGFSMVPERKSFAKVLQMQLHLQIE